jgi:hypothetical protein
LSVAPGDSVTVDFTTSNPSTGALADATGTPTGVLVRNGTDSAESVTVTNKATGRYKAAFTVPAGWSDGDEVDLVITATVAAVAGGDVVWRATLEVVLTAEDVWDYSERALTTNFEDASAADPGLYLITTDELFKRIDWNTLAQLCSDDTVKISTAAALAASDKMTALIHDASSMVRGNMIASGKFTVTSVYDITALDFGFVFRLMSRLIVCLAYERRPVKNPDPPPVFYDQTFIQLEALKYGDIELATA